MHIGVAQAGRGQGVGRRLVEAILTAAKEHGVRHITASVHSANVPAQKFFERLGFELVERYPMVMIREGMAEEYRSFYYVKRVS